MSSYRTSDNWRGTKCDTLADILEPGLACVFVGLNPSLVSVEKGHYLQGTLGRQFWQLLIAYGVLPDPGDKFPDEILLDNGLGITDLAKCPSPRADALTHEDIETGRAMLLHKIEVYQPKIVCSIYRKTLEVLTGRKYTRKFGLLPDTIGETKLFAAPFPYRPAEDVRTYLPQLRELIDEARADLVAERAASTNGESSDSGELQAEAANDG
jgi:double-stranded uracil-DNA glycosylase